jgi:hypothetical protein
MSEKGRAEGLIEQGVIYRANWMFNPIGVGAAAYMHLLTGGVESPEVFLDFSAQVLLTATVGLYEAPTLSADGTALPAYNMRRDATTPATVLAWRTPTVSADGTELDVKVIPGAAGVVGLQAGEYDPDREWILKKSTHYLIKVDNTSGLSNLGVITAIWREGTVN